MNIFATLAFLVFMYLLTSAYANAQEGYGNYYDYQAQQNQLDEMQSQQRQLQLQQNQRELNNSINAINRGCVYSGGQQFC